MFEAKFLWILIIAWIIAYPLFMAIKELEPFKKYREVGIHSIFEVFMLGTAFLICLIGMWVNGYEAGLKNAKTKSS